MRYEDISQIENRKIIPSVYIDEKAEEFFITQLVIVDP